MSASNRAVQLAWPATITHPVLVTFEVATSALTLLALRLFEEQDQPLRIVRVPDSSETVVYLVTDERAYRRCRVLGRTVHAHTERATLVQGHAHASTLPLLEQQAQLLTIADLRAEVRPAALPSLSSARAVATDAATAATATTDAATADYAPFVVVDTPDAACARRMQAFGYRARVYPCATTCLSYIHAPTALLTSLDAGWQAHEVLGLPHRHLPTEFLTLVGPECDAVLTYSYHKSHAFFSILSWHELEDSLLRCEEPGRTRCTVQAVWTDALDISDGSAWRERIQHAVEDRWAIDQLHQLDQRDQLDVGAPGVHATAHVVAWRRLADHEPAAGVAAANRQRLQALECVASPHPYLQQPDAGVPGPVGPTSRGSDPDDPDDQPGAHAGDHRSSDAAQSADATAASAAGAAEEGRTEPSEPSEPPNQSVLATGSSAHRTTSASGALLALPARPSQRSRQFSTPSQFSQFDTHATGGTIQDSQHHRAALAREQALVGELAAALEQRALALRQRHLSEPPVIDWLVAWLAAHNGVAHVEPAPEQVAHQCARDDGGSPAGQDGGSPANTESADSSAADNSAADSSAASGAGDNALDGGTYVTVGVEDLVDRLWYAAFRDEDFRRREGICDRLVPWLLRWPSSQPVQPRRLHIWDVAKPDEGR